MKRKVKSTIDDLDINLDNHYIRLWECFDNTWMQS